MKRNLLNALILAALVVPSVAMAADVETTEHKEGKHVTPASAYTVTSNVGLVSDYLYRGISQTGAGPAIQGGFDYAHASGLYAGAWGSSISWLSDAGATATQTTSATGPAIANSGLELDTYLGYKGSASDVGYDVGVLRYNYPGTYATGTTKADTNEIYGAVSYSIVTAKYSYSLGDTFGAPDSKGTSYLELNASYALLDTGITLGAHYGKQSYKGSSAKYTTFIAGNSPTYSDYKLSATKDFSGYMLGLALSNTADASAFYTNVQSKKLGESTAVLSLTRSF